MSSDRGEPFDYEGLNITQNTLAYLVRAAEDGEFDIEHLVDIEVCLHQLEAIKDLTRKAREALEQQRRTIVLDGAGGEVTAEDGSRWASRTIYSWKFDHDGVKKAVLAKLRTGDPERDRATREGYEAALGLYVSASSKPKVRTLDQTYGTPPWDVADRQSVVVVDYHPSEIAEALA